MASVTTTNSRRDLAAEGDRTPFTNSGAIVADVASKLPSFMQFPLVILLSFSFTFTLYTFASEFTGYELSSLSREVQSDLQIFAAIGWRIAEMAIGWYAGFDDYDMAALSVQSRLPYYYFLCAYYGLSLRTAVLALTTETLGAAIPFSLLRRRALSHVKSINKPNAIILGSWELAIWTTMLASAVYGLVVYVSARSWLPMHLILHFDGIRSLEQAYNVVQFNLLAIFIPLGWAARSFLFSPSAVAAGQGRGLNAIRKSAFNPATATLAETLEHNVWGYRPGWKVLFRRIAIGSTVVGLSSLIRLWATVEGTEPYGAAGWGAMWSAATVLVGLTLGWSAEL